jgi:hypothetical protein
VTAAVAAALLVLALLDGAFAGFRSSVGRTGLIKHRASDEQAARRGAVLVSILLAPAIVLAIADVLTSHDLHAYTQAGSAMVVIYAPSALLVLAALSCYAALGWRLKYLASAVILGPFTLFRPAVAIAGAVAGAVQGRNAVVTTTVILSAVAVLAVEPLADRRWYADRQSS